MKSSRPSLCESRDKRPLGRDTDSSWCHRHTTSKIKPHHGVAFLDKVFGELQQFSHVPVDLFQRFATEIGLAGKYGRGAQ